MGENIKDVYGGVDTKEAARELGITDEEVVVVMNTEFDGSPRTFKEWRDVHDSLDFYATDEGKATLAALFALARRFEEWEYVLNSTAKYRGYHETRKVVFAKMFTLAKTALEWQTVYRAAQ